MAVFKTYMSEPDALSEADVGGAHAAAAAEFAERVQQADNIPIDELLLFGSTARGEARGLASDVDFLAVVPDEVDKQAVQDRLRDLAYDVMLAFGPVVEVHVLTRSEFERRRDDGHPFVRRVAREGKSYA